MIYDFILYGGEDTFRYHKFTEKETTMGFGAQVVLALCKSMQKKPAFIYCDNFFTSPELFYVLREDYGIFGCGTIRSKRLRGAGDVLQFFLTMFSKKELHLICWFCSIKVRVNVSLQGMKILTLLQKNGLGWNLQKLADQMSSLCYRIY